MSEFVDECRREWRRLGVPDPIANEMAADLTADIDEAEAEGGSAEDVLGNSALRPSALRRGVGRCSGGDRAWAHRSVGPRTRSPPLPPGVGRCWPRCWPPSGSSSDWAPSHWPSVVAAPRCRSRSDRILQVPGSIRLFGPGQVLPPDRYFVPGPRFVGHGDDLLVVRRSPSPCSWSVLVAVALAVLFWSPWLPDAARNGSTGHRRDRPLPPSTRSRPPVPPRASGRSRPTG